VRELWEKSEPKRQIALVLARVRKQAGRTQKDIADITGWDKAFVSRLESALGGLPDQQTIARYVEACNAKVGLVVYTSPEKGQLHVVEAMPFNVSGNARGSKSFSELRDLDIELATGRAKA
jgi:transcriptional regulator with XRE-family HTH domain